MKGFWTAINYCWGNSLALAAGNISRTSPLSPVYEQNRTRSDKPGQTISKMWQWKHARSPSLSLDKKPMGFYYIFMMKLQLQKGGIQGDAYKQWVPDPFQGILPGIFPQTALQCKQAMGALCLPWHSLSCKNVSCYQWAVKQLKELTQMHSKSHQLLWQPCPRWQPFRDAFLTQCSVQEYCPLGTRGRLCCYSMQVAPWRNFSHGKAEGLELLCQVNITDFEGQVLKKGNASYADIKYIQE